VFCPAPNGAGWVLKTARSAGGILASAEGAESKFFGNRRARLTSTTGGALPAGGSTERTNGGGGRGPAASSHSLFLAIETKLQII
jgi:hypothetical protein